MLFRSRGSGIRPAAECYRLAACAPRNQKSLCAVIADGFVVALEIGGRSFAAQIAVDAMPRFYERSLRSETSDQVIAQ
jgi:hypothetical protein